MNLDVFSASKGARYAMGGGGYAKWALLAILIAALMIHVPIGATESSAQQAGSEPPSEPAFAKDYIVGGTGADYQDLSTALTAAGSGLTRITLAGDLTVSSTVTIADGQQIWLDLAGHTISATSNLDSSRPITNYGNLTVTDSAGSGKITSIASSTGFGAIDNYDELVIIKGTFEGNPGADGSVVKERPGAKTTIYGGTFNGSPSCFYSEGTSYIYGGTFKSEACSSCNPDSWAYAISNPAGKMYIHDCTVEGTQGALSSSGGYTEVHGGSFTTQDCQKHHGAAFYALYVAGEDGLTSAKVYDGTFESFSRTAVLVGNANDGGIEAGATIEIHGGDFSITQPRDDNVTIIQYSFDDETEVLPVAEVYGGTYDSKVPEEMIAPGYKQVVNAKGEYVASAVTPEEAAASVGELYFLTLEDAYGYAGHGDEIEVLKGEMAGQTLYAAKDLLVEGEWNLEGKTWYVGANSVIVNGGTLINGTLYTDSTTQTVIKITNGTVGSADNPVHVIGGNRALAVEDYSPYLINGTVNVNVSADFGGREVNDAVYVNTKPDMVITVNVDVSPDGKFTKSPLAMTYNGGGNVDIKGVTADGAPYAGGDVVTIYAQAGTMSIGPEASTQVGVNFSDSMANAQVRLKQNADMNGTVTVDSGTRLVIMDPNNIIVDGAPVGVVELTPENFLGVLKVQDDYAKGTIFEFTAGDYDVTTSRPDSPTGEYTPGTYGSAFVITRDGATFKAAVNANVTIYGFSNFFNSGILEGINGQSTIYVNAKGVTLRGLTIMPLGGIGENAKEDQKTVEVTAGADGFRMIGCTTAANDIKYNDMDSSMVKSAGLIHVSIDNAEFENNTFGAGTTVCAGWRGPTVDGGYHDVKVDGNNTWDNETGILTDGIVTVDGKVHVSKTQEALEQAIGNGAASVILDSDIELDSTVEISKDLTIDLNGHTIRADGITAIHVTGGTLTVTDSSAGQPKVNEGYEVDYDSGSITGTGANTVVVTGGKLILQGGTLKNTVAGSEESAYSRSALMIGGDDNGGEAVIDGGHIYSDGYGIFTAKKAVLTVIDGVIYSVHQAAVSGNGSNHDSTTTEISGGTLIAESGWNGELSCGVYHPQNGVLTISGGTIVSLNGVGVNVRGGVFTMDGGTVLASGDREQKFADSEVKIPSAGIVVDSRSKYPAGVLKAELKDGDVKSERFDAVAFVGGDDDYGRDHISVTGGTYSSDVSGYLGPGVIAHKETNGNWGIVPLFADDSIGTKENDPFVIETAQQLYDFRNSVNNGNTYEGYFIEIKEGVGVITVSGTWTPIGYGWRADSRDTSEITSQTILFSGTFNGNGATITGLSSAGYVPVDGAYNADTKEFLYGFFGFLYNATVTDLKLEVDFDLTEVKSEGVTYLGDTIGGLAAYAYGDVTVSGVTVDGTVRAYDAAGGIIGRSYAADLTVEGCVSNAGVSATCEDGAKVGGIIGIVSQDCETTTIAGCTVDGKIVSPLYAGTVIGYAQVGCVTVEDMNVKGAVVEGAVVEGVVVGYSTGIAITLDNVQADRLANGGSAEFVLKNGTVIGSVGDVTLTVSSDERSSITMLYPQVTVNVSGKVYAENVIAETGTTTKLKGTGGSVIKVTAGDDEGGWAVGTYGWEDGTGWVVTQALVIDGEGNEQPFTSLAEAVKTGEGDTIRLVYKTVPATGDVRLNGITLDLNGNTLNLGQYGITVANGSVTGGKIVVGEDSSKDAAIVVEDGTASITDVSISGAITGVQVNTKAGDVEISGLGYNGGETAVLIYHMSTVEVTDLESDASVYITEYGKGAHAAVGYADGYDGEVDIALRHADTNVSIGGAESAADIVIGKGIDVVLSLMEGATGVSVTVLDGITGLITDADAIATVAGDAEYTVTYKVDMVLDNLPAGTVVKLEENVDLGDIADEALVVSREITLDLNGHKLSASTDNDSTVGPSANISMVYVSGELTVIDSSADKDGSIDFRYDGASGTDWTGGYADTVAVIGELILKAGRIFDATADKANTIHYAVDVLAGGKFTMTGGSVESASYGSVRTFQTGKADISGGEVIGHIYVQPGRSGVEGSLTITGGTFSGVDGDPAIYADDASSGRYGISISGGVFNSALEFVTGSDEQTGIVSAPGDGELIFKDLTGWKAVWLADGAYMYVTGGVGKVTDDVTEALTGETVYLGGDLVIGENIDLTGKTVYTGDNRVAVINGAKVTGGTIYGDVTHKESVVVMVSGTLSGTTVVGGVPGEDGTDYNGRNLIEIEVYGGYEGGPVVIKDVTLETGEADGTEANHGIYVALRIDVTITGVEFVGEYGESPIVIEAGGDGRYVDLTGQTDARVKTHVNGDLVVSGDGGIRLAEDAALELVVSETGGDVIVAGVTLESLSATGLDLTMTGESAIGAIALDASQMTIEGTLDGTGLGADGANGTIEVVNTSADANVWSVTLDDGVLKGYTVVSDTVPVKGALFISNGGTIDDVAVKGGYFAVEVSTDCTEASIDVVADYTGITEPQYAAVYVNAKSEAVIGLNLKVVGAVEFTGAAAVLDHYDVGAVVTIDGIDYDGDGYDLYVYQKSGAYVDLEFGEDILLPDTGLRIMLHTVTAGEDVRTFEFAYPDGQSLFAKFSGGILSLLPSTGNTTWTLNGAPAVIGQAYPDKTVFRGEMVYDVTISWDVDGQKGSVEASGAPGAVIQLPGLTLSEGYALLGWSVVKEGYGSLLYSGSYTVSSDHAVGNDIRLVAVFEEPADTQATVVINGVQRQVSVGDIVILPVDPSRSFLGWSADGGKTLYRDVYIVTQLDVGETLTFEPVYAPFVGSPVEATIGGSSVGSYGEGDVITLPVLDDREDGAPFLGWKLNGGLTYSGAYTVTAADIDAHKKLEFTAVYGAVPEPEPVPAPSAWDASSITITVLVAIAVVLLGLIGFVVIRR